MKTILILIFIIATIIYVIFFRKRGFIRFKLFWDRSEKLYNHKLATGIPHHQALKEISMARHPELSEPVHEAMINKFDDINALINFIWWGLEKHLLFYKKEFIDKNALKLINSGRVIQKGYYDYRVIIDSEKDSNGNSA